MTSYANYSGTLLPESATWAQTIYGTGTETLYALSTPTRLQGSGQGNDLVGGAADDTLSVLSTNDHYSGGAGVDTVWASVNVNSLPGDIENLTMSGKYSPVIGVANGLANILKAQTAGVTLDGEGGDDVIFSAGGGDTFVFSPGSGKDIIYNFHAGASTSDVARLAGYGFYSFDDVRAAMTQVGSDVQLQLSPNDLVLFKNTTVGAFTAQNFELGVNTAALKQTFDEEFNSLSLQNHSAGGGTWATSFGWDSYNAQDAHNITGEREVYVDPQFAGTGSTPLGLNPFSINNGVLSIKPAATPSQDLSLLWNHDFTSGLLTTQGTFAQTYGYFEMRADLPDAKGVFPAFWLLPADNTFGVEIDAMEYVGEPNTVYNTVHYSPNPGDPWTTQSFKSLVPDLTAGYHTFGVLWTPQTITWYVDGGAVAQTATPAIANKPMYMLVNYAVGGSWAGDPTSSDLPPMNIDYVRAYSLDAAPVTAPTTTTTAPTTTTTSTTTTSTSTITPTPTPTPTATNLVGTDGADTLTGTTGADTMTGGAGDDTYIVNSQGDVVVEAAGGGHDTLKSSVSYTMPDQVEDIYLTGSQNITATGNALDNLIVGNGSNQVWGLGGNDTMISGAGGSYLAGGSGNDLYILGSPNDTVVEWSGQGVDTVQAPFSYTLPANVENLTLTTANAANGIGNASANLIIGGDGANSLDGGAGADTLTGGAGADTLAGGADADRLTGGTGNDVFIFAPNGGHDVVTDFSAGDKLDLSALFKAGLHAKLVTSGADTLVSFDSADDVLLLGVARSHLQATSTGFVYV